MRLHTGVHAMKSAIKALSAAASLVVLAFASTVSIAHHSAAQFDFTKPTTIEGTVKAFEVKNPHTRAVIALSDSKGTRDAEYEGHSASNFYRSGYTNGAVHVGEKITMTIAPRRDGKDGGFIVWFKTQSGKEVGFAALGPTGERKTGDQK